MPASLPFVSAFPMCARLRLLPPLGFLAAAYYLHIISSSCRVTHPGFGSAACTPRTEPTRVICFANAGPGPALCRSQQASF